jgi:hypothetical protein
VCVYRVCVTHRYILKYRTKITEVKEHEVLGRIVRVDGNVSVLWVRRKELGAEYLG